MLVPLLALLAIFADDPPAIADAPPDLNAKVLAFARGNLGEKVGNGQCTSLATAALREAGARSRFGRGDLSWGEPRESVEDARPGDILQFEDVTFVRRERLRNGGLRTRSYTFPHHTAIVAAVKLGKKGAGPVLTILHQNAGYANESEDKRKRVTEWTLDLDDLQGGTITAYRPAVRPPGEGPRSPAPGAGAEPGPDLP